MRIVMRTRIVPVLWTAVLLCLAAVLNPPSAAAQNPTVLENLQPGTNAWEIPWGTVANDTAKQIKGYASAVSVNKGGNTFQHSGIRSLEFT